MGDEIRQETLGEEWAVLREFLPPGWEEQARRSGALLRCRGVNGAEELLRILLIHLATGCSLTETATRAKVAELGRLSSVALHKRLLAAEEWLRWLAAEERKLLAGSAPTTERRLRAVDATVVSEPGSRGTDWRLHYAINLTNLQCDYFELTDVHGGETWRRIPVQPGDVMVGDRIYANPVGVHHVVSGGGEVVVRLNWHTLPLFTEEGKKRPALQGAGSLKVGAIRDTPTWVRPKGELPIRGRLLIVRRSAAATRAARAQLERKACRQQKKVSAESWKAAQYFMLWTTLEETTPADEVLDFYRCRWQIELAFKRMKSILGLGHLPKQNPATARAWIHGKLLTSLLVERIIQAADAFSPWGYSLGPTKVSLA